MADVEGGPLGPGSRTGVGCIAPRSSTNRIPGLSTIGRLGSGIPGIRNDISILIEEQFMSEVGWLSLRLT